MSETHAILAELLFLSAARITMLKTQLIDAGLPVVDVSGDQLEDMLENLSACVRQTDDLGDALVALALTWRP
jgi:hypothetical protein